MGPLRKTGMRLGNISNFIINYIVLQIAPKIATDYTCEYLIIASSLKIEKPLTIDKMFHGASFKIVMVKMFNSYTEKFACG